MLEPIHKWYAGDLPGRSNLHHTCLIMMLATSPMAELRQTHLPQYERKSQPSSFHSHSSSKPRSNASHTHSTMSSSSGISESGLTARQVAVLNEQVKRLELNGNRNRKRNASV